MQDDPFTYDLWIEEALRSVIARALRFIQTNGLSGDHHYYITFETGFDGVKMPDRLRAQYPDEMTIVLQNRFWDLSVDDEKFQVTLSFSGKSELLSIPLKAITAFADPSVKFGLQLRPELSDEDEHYDDLDPEDLLDLPEDGESNDSGAGDQTPVEKPKTGEVIALDAFRKK